MPFLSILFKFRGTVNVLMCSVKDGMPFDDACILEVGDHPFVQHQSYIDYRFCELRPADEIEAKVQEGTLVPHGDCSIALLRRIIASADASKRISREMKKFLRSVDLPLSLEVSAINCRQQGALS